MTGNDETLDAEDRQSCWAQDPGRVEALAAGIRDGGVTSASLVDRCLARIRDAEPHVEAWRLVDEAGARLQAAALDAERDAGRLRGPLHGVPIAIKDIIDVEGLPTRCNSRSRDGVPPAVADAVIVASLRAGGAVILGKAHTTEFAFFDPSPARNPHHTGHTPGGSSSGSAAAVAAGMAPLAIGTQTVASVNRPAAYCGVAAFKPSTGLLSTWGITPLAPAYDTPGFFGWSVVDAAAAFLAVCPAFASAGSSVGERMRIVRLADPVLDDADAEIAAAVDGMARALESAGHHVSEAASPVDFARLFEHQQTVTHYEAGRALGALREAPPGSIGPKLLGAIERGRATSRDAYTDARLAIDAARADLFDAFPDADAFLWPATPRTAPAGLEWTGDPRYIAPWTALGGPVVTVPAGAGAQGLPIGVLLCAKPGTDRALAAAMPRVAAAERRG